MDPQTYQFGLTKIFMKAGIIGLLEDRRTVKMGNAATAMQKHIRRIYAERAYAIQKKAVLRFQAVVRMCQCLKMGEYLRRERASAKLQTCVRTFNARKQYLEDRRNVLTLQKRKIYLHMNQHANIIVQTFVDIWHACHSVIHCNILQRRRFKKLFAPRRNATDTMPSNALLFGLKLNGALKSQGNYSQLNSKYSY